MKHAAPQPTTSDDINEDDQDDSTHHQHLIPPFLHDQTCFAGSLEQQASSASSAAQTKTSEPRFERYFEAVIRQVRHHPHMTGDAAWSFLIHFKGWNARYDRWTTASQLLPDTPLHRHKFEKQQQEAESQRQAGREAQKQEQLRKQQRKKDGLAKANTQVTDAVLPFTLKTVMVDEWEKINRRGFDAPYGYDNPSDDTAMKANGPPRSVHALPAAVTIRQLLKHFEKKARKQWQQKQEKEQQKSTDAEGEKDSNNDKLAARKQEIRQFCKSLGRVFEKALPACLLYPQERPQYEYYMEQHREDDVSVLDIYGCEFLLRLLVRLPHLMPQGKASPPLLADLTLLLQQNRPACFKGKFRPPIYPHEWLEWEKEHYGNSESNTTRA